MKKATKSKNSTRVTSTKQSPLVSITILNWNGLDDTLRCLESVVGQNYKHVQIVVVDNGSSKDEAAEIKRRFPNVKLIRNKDNLGFTGGHNQGMDVALQAGADYVLVLNNDVVLTDDALSRLVDFYQATPDAGMISPLILYADHERLWFAGGLVAMGMIRHKHKGEKVASLNLPKIPFKTDYVPGTAMLVSTKLIHEVGKLDDRYFAYYEDLDWCQRAEQHGYHAYVVPEAVVYHKKSGSTSQGGHRRFTKIPSYYLARNAFLLASNYSMVRKAGYMFVQIGVKLPLSLALLVELKAWSAYLHGTIDGVRALWFVTPKQ